MDSGQFSDASPIQNLNYANKVIGLAGNNNMVCSHHSLPIYDSWFAVDGLLLVVSE